MQAHWGIQYKYEICAHAFPGKTAKSLRLACLPCHPMPRSPSTPSSAQVRTLPAPRQAVSFQQLSAAHQLPRHLSVTLITRWLQVLLKVTSIVSRCLFYCTCSTRDMYKMQYLPCYCFCHKREALLSLCVPNRSGVKPRHLGSPPPAPAPAHHARTPARSAAKSPGCLANNVPLLGGLDWWLDWMFAGFPEKKIKEVAQIPKPSIQSSN